MQLSTAVKCVKISYQLVIDDIYSLPHEIIKYYYKTFRSAVKINDDQVGLFKICFQMEPQSH